MADAAITMRNNTVYQAGARRPRAVEENSTGASTSKTCCVSVRPIPQNETGCLDAPDVIKSRALVSGGPDQIWIRETKRDFERTASLCRNWFFRVMCRRFCPR